MLIFRIFIFQQINYHFTYFFNQILKNDNKIAAITSAIGIAFGNPKFHKNTPINQIKKKYLFKHGKTQTLPNGLIILPSYHPSPRNVNTKLINKKMMTNLFKKAKRLANF